MGVNVAFASKSGVGRSSPAKPPETPFIVNASLCLIALLSAVLPLIFRQQLWLRWICLSILLFGTLLHATHLVALHRLITIHGIDQLQIQPGGTLPEGFLAATAIGEHLSKKQIPFFLCLSFAFVLLAALPFQRPTKSESRDEDV